MQVKEYLEQAKFLDLRINVKQEQLNSLKDLKQVVDIPVVVEKIAALEAEINRDIDDLVNLKQDITHLIRRTPHAYEEFVNYEFEKNKADEWISGYPDKNNHTIDATRYALERVSSKFKSNA